jgi:hypothetical protein
VIGPIPPVCMAGTARRVGPSLSLASDWLMILQHAQELEAEAVGLEAQANALERQPNPLNDNGPGHLSFSS